jgi:hypothetical protein
LLLTIYVSVYLLKLQTFHQQKHQHFILLPLEYMMHLPRFTAAVLGHPFTTAASKQRPLTVTSLTETSSGMVNSRDRVVQIPGATGKSNYKIVMQADETR